MATPDCDVVVVGAGLAGLTAARDVQAAGQLGAWCSRRATAWAGALLNEPHRRRQGGGGGRPVGRARRSTACSRSRATWASTPSPRTTRATTSSSGATHVRYQGAIPRITPAVLADIAQAQFKLDRMAKRVPLEAPVDGAQGARPGTARPSDTWMRRNVVTRGARNLMELAVRGGVGCGARRPLAAPRALLHPLGRRVRRPRGHRRRRPAGPLRRRLAARVAQARGAARRRRVARRRRCAGSSTRTTVWWSTATRACRSSARRVIVAMPPTLDGADRLRPAAARAPRPADAAHAAGRGDQVHGRLRRARSGASAGSAARRTSDRGPVRLTFDNSPPDGTPGVLLGFLEGRFARELARADPRRAPGGRRGHASRGCFGPEAAEPERLPRARAGPTRSGPAAATALTSRPAAGPASARALSAPIGPIHWAGAETATVWNGYMDGAVPRESGLRGRSS